MRTVARGQDHEVVTNPPALSGQVTGTALSWLERNIVGLATVALTAARTVRGVVTHTPDRIGFVQRGQNEGRTFLDLAGPPSTLATPRTVTSSTKSS
jgi:hypothetical protein